jgi:steroid 5-alpha reductase family enzyme
MPGLQEMYRDKSPSAGPKVALAQAHLCAVAAAGWLLFGGGIAQVSAWLGLETELASPGRHALLLGAAAVYFLRTLVTAFLFLKRRMGWAEVGFVAAWVTTLQLLYAFLGGRQAAPVGLLEAVGVGLYLAGSCLNTGSEYQRLAWKRQPRHEGRLYSGGLFRYAMHVNYLGDLVLFTGWVFLARNWWLLGVPLLMLLLFVFVNIPALDRHLAGRYGEDFKEYAARTWRLIPFVY